MAKFFSFFGLRCDIHKVDDPASVMALPFDTLHPIPPDTFFVRLTLDKGAVVDNDRFDPIGLKRHLFSFRGAMLTLRPFLAIACIPGRLSSHANIRT